MTELPFLCGFSTGSLHRTKRCVYSTIWKKNISWGHFHCFKRQRLFRMNPMHGNTDNISHVPILIWTGMTSSLMSHGPLNDITQLFSLNSFHVLSFDTKMYNLMRRWEIITATQHYRNLPFVSINASPRKTVKLKTFLGIFPYPNYMRNVTIFDVSNGVNVGFVHRVI